MPIPACHQLQEAVAELLKAQRNRDKLARPLQRASEFRYDMLRKLAGNVDTVAAA